MPDHVLYALLREEAERELGLDEPVEEYRQIMMEVQFLYGHLERKINDTYFIIIYGWSFNIRQCDLMSSITLLWQTNKSEKIFIN